MITYALALKLIGGASLFGAVSIISLNARRRDGERLARLEAQIGFVRFVRERIDRYLLPIGEIFRECDGELLELLCAGCKIEYKATDVESLRAILRTGQYYADGGEIFDSFLARLGTSYREDEVAACDECIRRLSEIKSKLALELPKERKSRTVLGFCLAAALIIILI